MSESSKLTFLSLLVGVCAGLAAVALEKSISYIQLLVAHILPGSAAHWGYALMPALGMLLSLILIRFLVRDNIGHGVTKVLVAISRNDSRIAPHNMWSSLLTSSLTIGFGGSVGAEAPIVYTGAAFGSNIGRRAGLSYRNVTILVGCGAAAAIAGIFKAPLAGILFALEVLMFNVSMTSMMPLLLSSLAATVVSYLLLGNETPFSCTLAPFSMRNMPAYLVLGVFCGACSLYFTRVTLRLEDVFSRFRNPYLRWAVCVAGLAALIFLFPPLFGEGYNALGILLNGGELTYESVLSPLLHSIWGVPLFFLLILILKVVAMTLTNAGGGVGGTFGPTLFVGAIAGFVLVRTLNILSPETTLPEQNFVLVGMAGLMAGVMQAPMTAIFLIAEITGGYDLLLPLILCSTVSFGTTRLKEKYSIYTKRIAQTGDLLTHDSDQAVLTLLKTADLVRDKYPRLAMDSSLSDIMETVSTSTAAVFPVVDVTGKFQGMVEMDDIRPHLFDRKSHGRIFVYNLMHSAPDQVYDDEKMDSVMSKFDRTGAWRLPVVSHSGSYLGFISRSRILTAYREELKKISQD